MFSDKVNVKMRSIKRRASFGFTLIEIIVGLVISSIAISLVATVIFPLFARSVEPVFQIRAAELAQSILDDALSRRYDEATPLGGFPACSALSIPACSSVADLGIDAGESDRGDFDDVDDFNHFCASDNAIQDAFGVDLTAADGFANFTFRVCVAYDGNYNGVVNEADEINAKLITVTVTPPVQATAIEISAYRGNY